MKHSEKNTEKNIFQKINQLLTKPIIFLIRIYQHTLSPDESIFFPWLKGRVCAHHPHCSKYSVLVLKRYGFWPGIWYALDRVLHCTPSMTIKHDPDHYRIVFCSSAPIGVPFLQALANDARFEIVGVVTQPDKPAGRGMHLQENIIKTEAKKILGENTPLVKGGLGGICTPNRLNPEKSDEGKEFAARLTEKQADFLVVIAYGKILPQTILDIPKIGPINVHGSKLPNYRGASPIQSSFLNGDNETAITIMHMDAGMDTGDIIETLPIPINFHRTTKDIIQAFQEQGPAFLCSTLWKIGKNILGRTPQDHTKATLCAKIEKEDAEIDPYSDTLESVYRKYRAFSLRPKIYFIHENNRVIIEELVLDEASYQANKTTHLFQTADQKTDKTAKATQINPAISSLLLKPEGKKAMTRDAFKNGYLK